MRLEPVASLPLPEAVFQAWPELRGLPGEAFPISVDANGLYLGMPANILSTGIPDENVTRPGQPEKLAENAGQRQRRLKAWELPRRMLSQAA